MLLFLLALSLEARASLQAPATPPLSPGEVLAGLADLNFEVMGVKQGLPHDSVYGFAQDRRNFLWIATFGGLSRYDGYRLHNYVHDPRNPASLPDNNIRMLLPDESGGLWIATGNSGVIVYDPTEDAFHPLPDVPASLHNSHVFCMASDLAGGLWFGSQLGLVHYEPKTKTYEIFGKASGHPDADGFGEGSVFSVLEDRGGNLWVGGDHGLQVRRPGSSTFETVTGMTNPSHPGEFPPVWTVLEDKESRLWIGTDKAGVGMLNRGTGHIDPIPSLSGEGSLIGQATVRGIVEVRPNRFWIATYGNGLVTYNLMKGRAHRYERDLTASTPLSNDFIRGIYMDHTGTVWLGTDRGLSKVNPFTYGLLNIHSSPLRKNGLLGNEVRSVSAQGDRIWIGFDQGGFALIEPDGQIRNILPAPGVKPADRSEREVLAMEVGDTNVVYAGGAGLYEIDTRSLTYRPIPDPILTKQVVNALLVDGNDVWAATYSGLVRYDRVTRTARLYVHDVKNPGSIADNYVRDMLKASDGRLWITTRLGLDRFDPATNTFLHYRHNPDDPDSLPSDNIQPIEEDAQGRLWIGTIGEGLTVLWNWTPDGKPHFRSLNSKNGFPDGIALTVVRGRDGRIWSNTPSGLAVIDPNTLQVHTYTAADGLRASSQNLFSSASLKDGTLVFPGDEGLEVVRPELLAASTPAAPLVLTEITVPGERLSPVALAWRSASGGLKLSVGHRTFQASFAQLRYEAPEGVEYSYKLNGLDKDWIQSPTYLRTAVYTNLPAGNFQLLVRASSRLGNTAPMELTIPVTVSPAWYETGWFTLLKILGLLAVMILVVQIGTAVGRKRQAELATEVAIRTAELASKQTELIHANAQLAELATTDALTGAFNRRHFLSAAENEMERARRSHRPFTLLLIDADRFKSVNDTFGHAAGDEVLCRLVKRLTGQLRRNDVIARYGGEELVILMPDTPLEKGLRLAERLRKDIALQEIRFAGDVIRITISIGAAEADGDETVEEVLSRADAALYVAKNSGRNRMVEAKPYVARSA